MNDNDDTRSYNQLQQDNEQQDNEQQEKEVERLTLEVETLKAFERNRSQAYHSKAVVPEVDVEFAEWMFDAGYEFCKTCAAYGYEQATRKATKAWKARQDGVVDLGDV